MIDGSVLRPWPDDVAEALERFKQGDLIEQPPIVYAADLTRPLYALTAETAAAEQEAGEQLEAAQLLACEAARESCPPFGIITTQTCDLAERGEPEQPWMQVAPVYAPALDADDRAALLQRAYLVQLDGPELPGDFFVADLRIEVPIEKSALAGRTPIEGFASEDGYLQFANALGRRRARAALADVLDRVVIKTLRRKLERSRPSAQEARKWTYQVRVRIVEGERLVPVAVKLYIVFRGATEAASDDDHEVVPKDVVTWYEAWWETAHEKAEEAGIRLLPNEYLDSQRVDAELYDKLIEVDLSHLLSDPS